MEDKFNVVQFFENGSSEYVRRNVSAGEAILAVKHYTQSVAVRMGMVKQVIITDMLDQTVFEWVEGKIVFPTQTQIDEVLDTLEKN